MKKISFVLLLLVLLLISWKENPKQDVNEDSYITIIFKNPNIKDTIFYSENFYAIHKDQITYRQEGSFINNPISVSNKGKIFRIKASKPIFLYHHYYITDNYFNYYCFYPNDTLTFEYKEGVPYVESKKHKEFNYNYGSLFNVKNPTDRDESQFFNRFKRYKNDQELAADEIAKDKRELKLINFLDSLKAKKSINEADYKLNLSYFQNKEKLKSLNPMGLLKQPYNLADVGNTFLVQTAFEKIYKPKMINVSDGKRPNYIEQFENAVSLRNINVNNKKYLMFYYLENMATRDSKQNFLKCFAVFEKETKDEALMEYFKNKYSFYFISDNNKGNAIWLLDTNKNKKTFKEIISKYKGKVVYIDFWASWCAPCRAAMPNSIKLHEEYKDKNIEFIYLSIDNNVENWQKASVKENLSSLQNNFLAINYPEANLFQELSLKTIPRYVIFDKKGNLVNSNAPSPDSSDIKIQLDKYLKE